MVESDIIKLKRSIDNLVRGVNDLIRLCDALNTNLVELGRLIKEKNNV